IISDTTPAFNGTAKNVEGYVNVEVNGKLYQVEVVDGRWNLDTTTAIAVGETEVTELDEGNYTVTVNAVDADGNAIVPVTDTFTVDKTTDAVVTVLDTVETNDTTPEFSGTSKNVDGDLTIDINGNVYTVTPEANGNWTLDTTTAIPNGGNAPVELKDGEYTITIDAEDADGNAIEPVTDTFIIYTLHTITDAVTLVDTTVTSDTTPAFNGTAKNVEGYLDVEVNGKLYQVEVVDGSWNLDTTTAIAVGE
ncbi:MAG: hypothetical protein GY937_04940, partial [bacterium]|nr:hypothetical protein [bacterium]